MSHSAKHPRGVTVSINKRTGRAILRIYDAAGVLRVKSELAADDIDRALLVGCENWLNRKDPPANAAAPVERTLRLVS